MVSYCGQSISVVCRGSCVVRRAASTIALKAYSFNAPGPTDSLLGRKHPGDVDQKNVNHSDRKSKMAAMAAILKIYFSLLLLNRKAN